MRSADVLRVLAALAADETVDSERRGAAETAVDVIALACDMAKAWGGDENAGLRVAAFEDASACSDPDLGKERVRLGRQLDALCRAVGVPLDGSANASGAC